METNNNKENTEQNESSNLPVIPLPSGEDLLLVGLDEEKRNLLVEQYALGQLDVAKKAAELAIDAKALKVTLDTLSDTTAQAERSDTKVTIRHTKESDLGTTDIVMGNTDEAAEGGKSNYKPLIIIVGIVAVALVGIALANSL